MFSQNTIMIQPKISVVTVCYNAVNDIEKTILSVINQTYPNIEYLIIDGDSTDGTMDVGGEYKKLCFIEKSVESFGGLKIKS